MTVLKNLEALLRHRDEPNLSRAAVRALPALLRVARAAEALREWQAADGPADENWQERMAREVTGLYAELDAALADLAKEVP